VIDGGVMAGLPASIMRAQVAIFVEAFESVRNRA
jgi:hypothetical protein